MEQNKHHTTEKAQGTANEVKNDPFKNYIPRADSDSWKKYTTKTSTNVWRSSEPEEYIEKSANQQIEAPVTRNETEPAAEAKQEKEQDNKMEKKFDPMSYAELWKKYVPQTDTKKEKKTAPAYDADSWKKYVKPVDTEKQKKTVPAYDPDSWKKYVPSENAEKWKEYAAKAKTPGAGYTARNGYLLTLPACNDFNLFNFAQISAPSGVKIRFKLPFPINGKGLKKLEELVKGANGTLETE